MQKLLPWPSPFPYPDNTPPEVKVDGRPVDNNSILEFRKNQWVYISCGLKFFISSGLDSRLKLVVTEATLHNTSRDGLTYIYRVLMLRSRSYECHVELSTGFQFYGERANFTFFANAFCEFQFFLAWRFTYVFITIISDEVNIPTYQFHIWRSNVLIINKNLSFHVLINTFNDLIVLESKPTFIYKLVFWFSLRLSRQPENYRQSNSKLHPKRRHSELRRVGRTAGQCDMGGPYHYHQPFHHWPQFCQPHGARYWRL